MLYNTAPVKKKNYEFTQKNTVKLRYTKCNSREIYLSIELTQGQKII